MTKQFTKEEIQLMDKMGSLASMLDIVFEPSNSFQVESKTVKVNNKYLLSLTAYKDMSDTVYCQAGFKLQVIRNYGKVPLYTVALNKVQVQVILSLITSIKVLRTLTRVYTRRFYAPYVPHRLLTMS